MCCVWGCVRACMRTMWCVCVRVTAWAAVSDAQHAKSVSLASWPGWRSSLWEPHCHQRDGKSCWRCWIWCETYGKYRASTVLLESTLFICHVMVFLPGLAWLVWLGLACAGLAWLGFALLNWFGQAWFGLGWAGHRLLHLHLWSEPDASQKLVWSHDHPKCVVCRPSEMCTVNDVLHSTWLHSCQHLLGVNLSPKFVNLYFPYAGRVFCFFAGTSSILNSNRHVWQWKEEAMLC